MSLGQEKTCRKCGCTKRLDDFYKGSIKGRSFHMNQCKKCMLAQQREYQALPEVRRRFLARKYGRTMPVFEALFDSQAGRCAICAEPLTGYGGRGRGGAKIDHCHRTGLVRGLLCNRCNSGLGVWRDDPVALDAAARYLRRAEERLKESA